MYDIIIQKNGGLYLLNGDLNNATYDRYIAQKLYAAVMEIPPDLLSGRSTNSATTMQSILQQYFVDRFRNDTDINPSNISCIINENLPINDSISYSLTYNGISPDGKSINYNSNFSFLLESGALHGVNYDIKFPNINLGDAYEVEEYITISSMSNELELPVTPMLGPDVNVLYSPIVLIPQHLSGSIGESSMVYNITTNGTRKTYQLDNYINGYDLNKHTVGAITSMYTTPDNMTCTIFDKYGKLIIRTSDIGSIQGTVSVITAKYITYDILYSDTYINKNVFRLKPTSGKCIAVFPGTISPGDYILKYTGVTQPWV